MESTSNINRKLFEIDSIKLYSEDKTERSKALMDFYKLIVELISQRKEVYPKSTKEDLQYWLLSTVSGLFLPRVLQEHCGSN